MIVEAVPLKEAVDVIVGIDPGETTGVCVLELARAGVGGLIGVTARIDRGKAWGYEFPVSRTAGSSLVSDEARFCHEMMERLDKLVQFPSFPRTAPLLVHLAVEDFVLRERQTDRSLLSPVRLTAGLMALVSRSRNLYHVEMQSAADAKSSVGDSVLHSSGLYWAGMPHGRDAARHAILYARKYG